MNVRIKVPTDLAILNAIYRRYYAEYAAFSNEHKNRGTKLYVPVDIEQIALTLQVDRDIVFGRLYYHLEHKYAYKQDGGAEVHFFTPRIAGDHHCVHFPLMASVLADLQEQSHRHNIAIWISVGSLLVSVVAVVVAICFRG